MAHQLKSLPLDLFDERNLAQAAGSSPLRAGVESSGDPPIAVFAEPRASSVAAPPGQGLFSANRPIIAEAIAHELRATLALISGYSQTVQHLPLDNDVRMRYLERISSASMSLAELTDEVVAVALSPRRGAEPTLEPLSLRQVYARVAGQLGAAIDSLRVGVDVPVDLPLVEADPIWITLVVRSLVTNAAKYAAGSAVCVSAWQSGEWVITRVIDDGDGVDEAERSRLFEPAFRGRRARESGSPGSGQGLYLCRRVIQAHGGRMWIDDTGAGFGVCFSLPRLRSAFLGAADLAAHTLIAVGAETEQRGA